MNTTNSRNPKNSIMLIHGFPGDFFYDFLIKSGEKGKIYVTEGRPYLEGAKEVAPKLKSLGFSPVLISDNMIGYCLWKGLVEKVSLFYQALDEDGALCKVGSLVAAVCAKRQHIKTYLFPAGKRFPFWGDPQDVGKFMDWQVAPLEVNGYLPLLEKVPWTYIDDFYQ